MGYKYKKPHFEICDTSNSDYIENSVSDNLIATLNPSHIDVLKSSSESINCEEGAHDFLRIRRRTALYLIFFCKSVHTWRTRQSGHLKRNFSVDLVSNECTSLVDCEAIKY